MRDAQEQTFISGQVRTEHEAAQAACEGIAQLDARRILDRTSQVADKNERGHAELEEDARQIITEVAPNYLGRIDNRAGSSAADVCREFLCRIAGKARLFSKQKDVRRMLASFARLS